MRLRFDRSTISADQLIRRVADLWQSVFTTWRSKSQVSSRSSGASTLKVIRIPPHSLRGSRPRHEPTPGAVPGVRAQGVRTRGHLPRRRLHRNRLARAARVPVAFAVDCALRAERGAGRPSLARHDHVCHRRPLDVACARGRRNTPDSRQGSGRTIATDLLRPLNVPFSFFSDGFGRTVFHALVVVPSLLCALLLVHIDVPPLPRLALFGFALLQGYIVNSLLNFLMNSVAFWTLETFAIQLMVRWVSDLLSGQIIPLSFFAGSCRNAGRCTPIRSDLLDAAATTGQIAPELRFWRAAEPNDVDGALRAAGHDRLARRRAARRRSGRLIRRRVGATSAGRSES